jgi:predicted transcriptional regulator
MRPLGDLEAVVMGLIWDSPEPVTVRAVLERMDREPPLAYTTVLTVIGNLHRKGYVSRVRSGRAFSYTPTRARAEYTADIMDELLSGSSDRPTTLLRFVDRMTPEEVSALKRVLRD